MEDIYVLGISHNYTPPSPAFNIETLNASLYVENNIDSITKISCCASTTLEERFKSLDTNYIAVHVNVELRVDYMSIDTTINFHRLSIDKIIYINIGTNINKTQFNINAEILDLDILDIRDNLINMYIVLIVCAQ